MTLAEDDECPCSNLPLVRYDYVLGAAIAVNERAICEALEHGRPQGGLPADIDVRAYGRGNPNQAACHRYLAAWARRNLFEGVGPR